MSWLDKGVSPEEFGKFKTEVNQKLNELTDKVQRKITDDEAAANLSAQNAQAAEQRILATEEAVTTALGDLEKYRDQALAELQNLQQQVSTNSESNKTLSEHIEQNKVLHSQLLAAKAQVDEFVASITQSHTEISAALAEAQKLPEYVEATQKLVDESKELSNNHQSLLSHSMKRKADIDELHKSICGYDVKNSDGVSEHVDGLKDELESSYKSISDQIESLDTHINELTEEITEKHKEQLSEERVVFDKLVDDSNEKVTAVSDQLKALLPGAMAAGLSAAYEAKKNDEETALKGYERGFKWAIGGMALVSLIPLAVDVYLLNWKGADLIQVIQDTPNLIISILPLYFPVLWLAYSTNKKLNLSKRLIEEYTHKAVLGKTFSGLSNQIETLPHESAVKDELRTRLLFNVLQVSSENPGKLITNYQKSDHPLMEALENSAKLSESVDALTKIPGLSSIAKKLSEKSDEILRAQQKKVDTGLAAQEALASSDESKS
jgi:hypothetical protein